MKHRTLFLVGILIAGHAFAQSRVEDGIEVRRAVPVQPAATPEPAVPTAPAVPFEALDAPTPNPVQGRDPAWLELVDPTPSPESTATPPPTAEAAPTPAEAEPPAPEEASRAEEASPTPRVRDEAASQLQIANGLYARKMYDLALPEYEKFLVMRSTKGAEGREEALFRLAESHRFLGNDRAAQQAYRDLVEEFDSGEYVGSGAFRLAEVLYASGRYGSALELFRTSQENVADKTVQATARFYEARSLDNLESYKQAAELYEQTLETPEAEDFHSYARIGLAEIAARNGEHEKAARLFAAIAEEADQPMLKAEAYVKAGNAEVELGDKKSARELFDKAARVEGAEEWHPAARISALRMAYELNDYEAITKLTTSELESLPGESLPNALLLVANAHRQLGNHERAAEMYTRLMREFPKADAVDGARFHRLVSLYSIGDPTALEEIDAFLLTTTDPKQRNQAYLLKAELLFKDENYEKAAELYQLLQQAPLDDNIKADSLYKLGWSLAQQQKFGEAADVFTRFIRTYPQHPKVASALAQRALGRVQAGSVEAAIQDFNRLIEEYPKAAERELALQQKGLLLGQQGQTDQMVETLEALLEEYPKTNAAGQAHFWLGWADFEKENYEDAIPHLDQARKLDPDQYQQRATLRLILAHYYSDNQEAVAEEVARVPPESVPAEISRWLGLKFFEQGDYQKANNFLGAIVEADPSSPVDNGILLTLAEARIKLKQYDAAQEIIDRQIKQARDPVSRARGLMAYGRALQGQRKYDQAVDVVEEAMLLQPEGEYNAEARMLNGEILLSSGQPEKAARLFMTVAVLHNDPELTPKALAEAHLAFQKAGNVLESRKALRELIERFPESPEAKEMAGRQRSSEA